MTTLQIVSVLVVAAVAAYLYLPRLEWPAPSSMRQVKAVLSIRDATSSPEVRKACTQLLQALLQ